MNRFSFLFCVDGAAPVVGVAQSTYDAVDVPLDIENQYAPAPARSVVAASVANRTYDHVSDKISVASASNYSPAPVAPAGYQVGLLVVFLFFSFSFSCFLSVHLTYFSFIVFGFCTKKSSF